MLAYYNGYTRFDDARLFAGNQFQGITQHIHVVPADVGDYRKQRGDYIGRIEPTTQSNLHYGYIYLLFGEIPQKPKPPSFQKKKALSPQNPFDARPQNPLPFARLSSRRLCGYARENLSGAGKCKARFYIPPFAI
jgi:hypothetical protein